MEFFLLLVLFYEVLGFPLEDHTSATSQYGCLVPRGVAKDRSKTPFCCRFWLSLLLRYYINFIQNLLICRLNQLLLPEPFSWRTSLSHPHLQGKLLDVVLESPCGKRQNVSIRPDLSRKNSFPPGPPSLENLLFCLSESSNKRNPSISIRKKKRKISNDYV